MERKKVLIYGFGEAGKQILKDSRGRIQVVGFLDDDPSLRGREYRGVKVLGGEEDIERVIGEYGVEEVIIAIPSAPLARIREIEKRLIRAGVRDIKILPTQFVGDERVYLRQVVELDPVELIGEEDFHVDIGNLRNFFRGRSVLVTGGAGFIGSRIVKHLLDLDVKRVISMDIDETRLFEQKDEYPSVEVFLGDVTSRFDLEQVFSRYDIDVVFHAAAYKHVPLLEDFPWKAVEVNVYGTKNVVEASRRHGVGKLVFISTDKAVNPAGIMGMSKRVAEEVVRRAGYISVRFVNVIGSRGSVVPLFIRQIESGRKITLTHEEASRYFMDVNKAVYLIFQSTLMGRGGEIFFLKPSRPIRIKDLAEKLIRLYGYEPYRDVDIEIVGLRKGEKLEEEIFENNGNLLHTEHPMIYAYRELDGLEEILEAIRDRYGISVEI